MCKETKETEVWRREAEVWEILRSCGAFKTGHFVLTSGFHSDQYIEKVLATNDPRARRALAGMIVDWILSSSDKGMGIQVVVGTPMGAISLATEVSSMMGLPMAFLEKDGKTLVLRGVNRQAVEGGRVLLVEDIITKGTNTAEALKVLREAGAVVVAVSCIVNREGYRPDVSLFLALATTPPGGEIKSFPPDSCPLCAQGVPISTDSGHGAKFLAELRERDPEKWKVLSGQGKQVDPAEEVLR